MRAFIFAAVVIAATPALADPQCTTEPIAKWQPKDDFKNKIVAAEGYKVDVFKVTTGNCYELYGRDKGGKRIEIYYNPISGEIVKSNAKK